MGSVSVFWSAATSRPSDLSLIVFSLLQTRTDSRTATYVANSAHAPVFPTSDRPPKIQIVQLPQATITISNTQGLDEMAQNFVHIVKEVFKRGAKTFEVTPEGEQAWLDECLKLAWGAKDQQAVCTPG